MGDIEVICQSAPVEVGSRVWRDLNNNGILDANDQPLPNVPIELFNVNLGEVVATVNSDSSGRFAFSSGSGTDTEAFAYNISFSQGDSYLLRTLPNQGDRKSVV